MLPLINKGRESNDIVGSKRGVNYEGIIFNYNLKVTLVKDSINSDKAIIKGKDRDTIPIGNDG